MCVFFTYGHVCEALVDERRSLHTFFVMSSLKSSLLCLLTTHDTAGSGQIGIAKKEHQKMSRLIPRKQAKQRVVKLVAAK